MKRGIVAVVAALMLGVATTAAQAASLPVAAAGLASGPYVVEPTGFTLSQDGAFLIGGVGPHFGHITWSYWNSKSASGTGVAWQNACRPDCARGTYHGFRVRLWLWRPALLNGREMFTRLKYKYLYNIPPAPWGGYGLQRHGRNAGVAFWSWRYGGWW
jgi:hypothetical protein